MATIKLNIYSKTEKNKVEKIYTAESYDLMLGTVEDIMQVIDLDKLKTDMDIAKVVVKIYPQLKPFLKDVFEGLTDDELKQVKVKELVPTFLEICKSIVTSFNTLRSGN